MPPISANIITKNNAEGLKTCIESLYTTLLGFEGDEVVVVDTGSTDEQFEKIKALEESHEGVRVIDRRDLAVDYRPLIKEWLPEFDERLEKDETYADCRGVLDFAGARQVALEASKNDLVFWIDTDDIIEDLTEGAFRKRLDESFGTPENPKHEQLFLDYAYAFGPDLACTTLLRRERFFWRDRTVWAGRCHETALTKPGVPPAPTLLIQDLPVRIKHCRPPERTSTVSDIRNYVILRNEVEETKDHIDPRTLLYLANAARGLERFQEAIELYKTFDGQSGSVDDRYAAAYYVGSIYMTPKVMRPVNALDYFSKCTEIKTEDPRGYFGMARAYGALQRWQEAIHWYTIGAKLPPPQTLHSFDPTHINWYPHLLASIMYKELECPDDAVAKAKLAFDARPDLPDSKEYLEKAYAWAHGHKFVEDLKFILAHIPGGPPVQRKVVHTITKHMPALPYDAEKKGIGKPEPPDPRRPSKLGRTIDFFCGGTLEPWGPICRQTGIGGSEKMVLILAPQLQRLGYNVTVYGEFPPDQRGVLEDGTRWLHWSCWDEKKPRDILVYWRNIEMAKVLKNPAKKKVLWTHDVQNPGAYNERLFHVITDFQYQSEFHAAPVKKLIDDKKLWIARNAIESGMYKVTEGDPKRAIFMSSPDRGLATALSVIRVAQQIDPEINITVMYGFTPFYRQAISKTPGYHRHCPDLGRDCGMDDYERLVWSLADGTGARFIHRVGFEQVAEELSQAGMWLYPTRFPEISCMGAMETQAAGLVPVCTRYGALAETILPEAKQLIAPLAELKGPNLSEEWVASAAKAVIEASQIPVDDDRRRALSEAAKRAFSVKRLAKQWHERLGTPAVLGGPPASKSEVSCCVESRD